MDNKENRPNHSKNQAIRLYLADMDFRAMVTAKNVSNTINHAVKLTF
jgi:hypothetical protein